MEFQANVSFTKMEKSMVCLDITKHVMEKKARISASKGERRRFKPKARGKYVSGAILEMIFIPKEPMTPKEDEDLCFRLNGELAPLPQNEEEDKMLDKTIWDYMIKRAANNISDIVEKGNIVVVWVGGESVLESQGSNGIKNFKELVYPLNGELNWTHPWTGAKMKSYKAGYIVPQSGTYTSFTKMCL